MTLSLGYSPWLLLLSLAIAGGLTYWSYRRTIPALSTRWRALLAGLRFASLALICLLLLEPVVRHLDTREEPPVLAVLLDNTESMTVVTGGPDDTSSATVHDELRTVLDPLSNNLSGTLRPFTFDGSLDEWTGGSLDSLSFDGSRTDLGTALQRVQDEMEGDLDAVALVSDGQYNSGQNPSRIADRFSVPIHTVTIGDTTRRRDLRIRRVITNDLAYVDSDVPVQVRLAAEQLEGESTTVSLVHDGSVLNADEVQLPEGSGEVSVELTYRPTTDGLKQLTIRAAPLSDEQATENNVRRVSVRVLENERRVLLLGAAPSPTFASIRRVLEQNTNTELVARIPQKDGSFAGGPLPNDVSEMDVVVCAGFPSAAVPSEAVSQIASVVEDGTPALFFLDRQTDVEAWTTHFDGLLPIEPEPRSPVFSEGSFQPVERERSHPVFRFETGTLDTFETLPPLHVPTPAWPPTPDAQVLAEGIHPERSESTPLLILRRRAGHRTAAFLGTRTWRWTLLPAHLEAADTLWPTLVSNLLRWAATQSDDRRVRIEPITPRFEGDEPVAFSGQVYDESMTAVADAQVSLTITDSAGTEYPHSMEPLGNGRYSLDVGPMPEGTYRFTAVARDGATALGRDRGQFSVGALRLEYQQTRADPVLMRQIAARSDGRAYTPETVGALPEDLAASSAFSSNTVTDAREAELWRSSLFLVLILLFLTTEWTLRKRFGLT